MVSRKLILFCLSILTAQGVFATNEIVIKVYLGDGRIVSVAVSEELNVGAGIETVLRQFPEISEDDYEVYDLYLSDMTILDTEEKLSNYNDFSTLQLRIIL